MGTIVSLYCKGNEIISWRSLCVRLCLVLNNNYCCMHYHRRNMLHQICMSRISNDNVHHGSKIVFGDDNIHLSLCVVGEEVKNLSLYVSSTFQCNSCNDIFKCIMGCSAIILTRTT